MAEVTILTVGCDWALRQAPAGALTQPHSVSFAENLQECREILGKRRFDILVIGPELDEAGQNDASKLATRHNAQSVLIYGGNAAPFVPAKHYVPVHGPMAELMSALERAAIATKE